MFRKVINLFKTNPYHYPLLISENDDIDYVVRIIVLGNKGSGKSSLISRFVNNQPPSASGANAKHYQKVAKVSGKTIQFKIFEYDGSNWLIDWKRQDELIRRHGFISAYVVSMDLSKTEERYFESLYHNIHLIGGRAGIGKINFVGYDLEREVMPILVAGTKSDLPQTTVLDSKIVPGTNLFKMDGDHDTHMCAYVKTSAKTGDGIDELFSLAAEYAMRNFSQKIKDYSDQRRKLIDAKPPVMPPSYFKPMLLVASLLALSGMAAIYFNASLLLSSLLMVSSFVVAADALVDKYFMSKVQKTAKPNDLPSVVSMQGKANIFINNIRYGSLIAPVANPKVDAMQKTDTISNATPAPSKPVVTVLQQAGSPLHQANVANPVSVQVPQSEVSLSLSRK